MNRGLLFLSIALLLSGVSSLGYELAWIRMLSVGLGHEYVASLAVVAAFFFGLALGALATDKWVSRSVRPAMWYAGFELTIGIWATVLSFVLPHTNHWMAGLLGVDTSPVRHWLIAFFWPAVLLLPATASMGGTLTALDCIYIRRHHTHWSVGRVYSVNTVGAALGIVVSVFVMVPACGYQKTLWILAFFNLCCAAMVYFTRSSFCTSPDVSERVTDAKKTSGSIVALLFLTGFLGIGFEVLIVRALNQVMAGTVYTLSNVLAIYLSGNAIGAALHHRFGPRIAVSQRHTLLLTLVSTSMLLSILGLYGLPQLHHFIFGHTDMLPWHWLIADTLAAAVIMGIPTIAMGALFAHLAQEARTAVGGLGCAVGVNTLGGAVAPFAFGIALLPVVGLKNALLAIPIGYLLPLIRSVRKQGKWLLIPAGLTISVVFCGKLSLVTLPEGARILANEDGVMANITVVEDESFEVHLYVDNHYQMGGTSSYFTDRRQTHIPLLLHPNPKRALFLGVGTGTTIAAAGDHPGLTAVGVELIPEVVPQMHHFEKSTGNLANAKWLSVQVADARRYVIADRNIYDVIIADLFHPARDGAASLYTREHFAQVKQRLSDGGIFCQWLPLYQLDMNTLHIIIRTFLAVFPNARMFMAHYGVDTPMLALISNGENRRLSTDWFTRRVSGQLAVSLNALRLTGAYELFGTFMAGPETLTRLVGPGSLNTDDSPQVMFSAPAAMDNAISPGERMVSLLLKLHPRPDEIVDFSSGKCHGFTAERLDAYWLARNRFIAIGTGMPRTRNPHVLLEHAAGPLLGAVRLSRDFTPAYNPLLGIAAAIARSNPAEAVTLLTALHQANPYRTDASRLLEMLRRRSE